MYLHLIFSFTLVTFSYNQKNECSTYLSYLFMSFSPNCYHNRDIEKTQSLLVTRYGYPYAEFKILTEDGYYLRIGRLPNSGPPIFLQHGMRDTSLNWLQLRRNSMPFKLFEQGYDVWLGNLRGSHFSDQHVNESISREEYWDFSWHEHGVYDVSAMLNYISIATNFKKKIIYIGISLGSTISFVYASMRSQEAQQNLLAIISLAPVAYMRNINILIQFAASLVDLLTGIALSIDLYSIGIVDISQIITYWNVCNQQITRVICYFIVQLATTLFDHPLLPEQLPMFTTYAASTCSLKVLIHYAQNINADGNFQQFDYGVEKNLKLYSSRSAPGYDVRKINVPVHLFYGKLDRIATEENVIYLYNRLETNKSITAIPMEGPLEFGHLDFLISPFIVELYKPLFKLIRDIEYNNNQ